jgi:hypothetical protein
MKLIIPSSIEGFINHFASYLIEIFPNNEKSYVNLNLNLGEKNILVINGDLNKTIFDLKNLWLDFLNSHDEYRNYSHLKEIKIIDNTYNTNSSYNQKWMRFYNTPRPLYNEFQIRNYVEVSNYPNINSITESDIFANSILQISNRPEIPKQLNNLTFENSFPHGYGVDYLKKLYWAEFFSKNIFRVSKSKVIDIALVGYDIDDFILNESSTQLKTICMWSEKKLVSLLYDTLTDFDMEECLLDYNHNENLFNPISDKPWLVEHKLGELTLF